MHENFKNLVFRNALALFYMEGIEMIPLIDYRTPILKYAPNVQIFHDFGPFNIRKLLVRPFLGFLFEISKKFYVDNFFHIQSNPSMRLKMHLFLGPFWGQKW